MPQITLQYTANIDQEVNFSSLFAKVHYILNETGGINIDNCKSRAVRQDTYYIGQGETNNAFVHLEVRFLEGRSAQLKKKLGQELLDCLTEIYVPSIEKHILQITVEIDDIKRELYFKFPAGSFTPMDR
jgi:5-carboxymethyl-2-hydroxymuconate isomerase